MAFREMQPDLEVSARTPRRRAGGRWRETRAPGRVGPRAPHPVRGAGRGLDCAAARSVPLRSLICTAAQLISEEELRAYKELAGRAGHRPEAAARSRQRAAEEEDVVSEGGDPLAARCPPPPYRCPYPCPYCTLPSPPPLPPLRPARAPHGAPFPSQPPLP